METLSELHQMIKERFPAISAKAYREYQKYWGEDYPVDSYSWMQSLANALNNEMQSSVIYSTHSELFSFVSGALTNCSEEVFKGIDVSFVENLFWQVTRSNAEPYWLEMPNPLKELYVGFHHRTPL